MFCFYPSYQRIYRTDIYTAKTPFTMVIIQSLIDHHFSAFVFSLFKLKNHVRTSRKTQSTVNTSLFYKKRNVSLSGWRQIRYHRTSETWINSTDGHIVIPPFLLFSIIFLHPAALIRLAAGIA